MPGSNASARLQLEAVSRSYQYRKVMKPLLERKRRARINKCLDELKQLIMDLVQMDEETLSKLEKADILELTVHHLHGQHKLANKPNVVSASSLNFQHFWYGFQQCIVEISRHLDRQDIQLNAKVMKAMQQLMMPQRPSRFWRPW